MNLSFGLEGVLKRKGPFFCALLQPKGKAFTPTMLLGFVFDRGRAKVWQ